MLISIGGYQEKSNLSLKKMIIFSKKLP